jgi:hypothetical protein
MLYRAECDSCGYSQRISDDGLRSYQMPGDVRVTIRHQFAWCRVCGMVVVAERLPTSDQLTKELADVEQMANERPDVFASPVETAQEGIDRERKQLLCLIQIIEDRRSPERCLQCGSTSIIPIPPLDEDDEDEDDWQDECFNKIEHPNCGGLLTLNGIGFSLNRTWTFYTTEGEKVQKYEVFPSRGLVPMKELNQDKT